MISAATYLNDFVSLFYPSLCAGCGYPLRGREHVLCTPCMHTLPETGFHTAIENPVMSVFVGRLPLQFAFSLLFFDKGSKYRHLIHQLKYEGRKETGIFLGKMMGSRLQESGMANPDCLVPVPLHKAKHRRRGYNQSRLIAEGMASVLHLPVMENLLLRTLSTPTQTRKARYERWQNVEGIFACHNPEPLAGKHILLIDDVITTGATLEAAGSCLLKVPGVSLSVASAAYAL